LKRLWEEKKGNRKGNRRRKIGQAATFIWQAQLRKNREYVINIDKSGGERSGGDGGKLEIGRRRRSRSNGGRGAQNKKS